MALYVPPTGETDTKKQNMSLQLIGGATSANTTNIATNTTNIATNTANIATNTTNIAALQAGPLVAGAVAAKSDQTTATSTTLAVTPARQQFHPSAAKAWVSFTGSTGAILASFNVSSVTRTGAGLYTVNFTVAFTSANYAAHPSSNTAGLLLTGNANQLAGSFDIRSVLPPSTNTDPAQVFAIFFGTQ